MTGSRRTFLRGAAVLAGSTLAAGCLAGGPSPEEQVRSAAESFESLRAVSEALDAGYRAAAKHVHGGDGGLGEVFLDQEQPFEPSPDDLDPDRPQLLYSRLTEDGRYEPAGVGWFVAAETTDGPPTLFDTSFTDGPSGLDSVLPEHYALNAWVFDDDPGGVFDPLHPDLTGPSFVDDLSAARGALAPFVDSEEAEAAGYENTEKHAFGESGLYGVSFVDREAPDRDLARPPILLYRMTDQWYYELLGAEWHVPVAGTDDQPTMFGQEFHEPMPGHSTETDQPEHYGLHAWLFRANPDGMFAPFNPRFG